MSSLLITQAHLLDPVAGELSDASWLEVADGRIAATGTGPAPASGEDTRVIDAAGATVMPGLIDAHVHVLLTTFDPHDAQNWTAGYATVRALAEAERMLRRGFTTVRDVGGADHGMARAIDEGLATGPRLIFGGKALSQTGATATCAPNPMTTNPAARSDRISRASPTEWMRYVRLPVTSSARAQHI